jgi:tetratricopeptide (TPR) repeat protein
MRRAAATFVLALLSLSPSCAPRPSDCGEGCGDDGAAPPSPFARAARVATEQRPVAAILEVEHGGCERIVAASDDTVECLYVPGRELRLWVTHPRLRDVRLELDGQPWAATPYQRREEPGQGYRGWITGDEARELVVRVPDERAWTLRLRAEMRLTAAERATVAGHDERATALEAPLYLGRVDRLPELVGYVDELLARGLLDDAVDLAQAASFHLENQAGRPELARELLEHVREAADRYPEGRASMAIYGGHLLEQEGRLVEAAAAYRRGARYAVRMDDAGLQLDALSDYAMVLAELGYFEAAVYWGARAVAHAREQGRLGDRMAVMAMVARVSLRLRELGEAHDDPGPLLREVLALAATAEEPANSGDVEPARLGLAALASLDGMPGVALRHLDELDEAKLGREDRLEARDVRLRAQLARGATTDVLREQLAGLEAFVTSESPAGSHWLAAVRRGEVLERSGDLDGAHAAYERSEDVLDRMIPSALLGVQGELAPARRREGTQRLVALLLRRGRVEEALCASRRAQARVGQLARVFSRLDLEARQSLRLEVERYRRLQQEHEALLRSMAERAVGEQDQGRREAARILDELQGRALEILSVRAGDHVRPTCDELRPRSPGELILGLYPHGEALLVFVQDDVGTTHRVLSDPAGLTRPDDDRWLADVLLDPLDTQLARASRVRVLASGEAAAIDVHALPWRGRSLVEQVPVVYSLDLPRSVPSGEAHRSTGALVLADAWAKGTEREAADVFEGLRQAGWGVRSVGSTEQAAHQLRQELSSVDHLHYAGHAYYDAGGQALQVGPRGRDGEDVLPARLWPPYPGGAAAEPSYIPLGSAGRLDVQDVLMMEQVPRSVVLMGCATGVHDERMAYGGFSLATAFLGAGAEVVVASTREVDGAEASLVGRGLYGDFGERSLGEPGAWLMHAMRWAREHGLPERAVRDYRVLVP